MERDTEAAGERIGRDAWTANTRSWWFQAAICAQFFLEPPLAIRGAEAEWRWKPLPDDTLAAVCGWAGHDTRSCTRHTRRRWIKGRATAGDLARNIKVWIGEAGEGKKTAYPPAEETKTRKRCGSSFALGDSDGR